MRTTNNATTHSATVGNADEFELGDMKMRSVGERRIVVIRTSSGIHALDNACPHQGYGLATGALDGELITCQWHNWKFDASTGRCVMGEEDVACHAVDIADSGDITVTVTELTNSQKRAQLWPSLGRAIESAFVGQISRDAIRLLEADAGPEDIMWAAFEPALAKNDYGPGHEMAMATDCLTIALSRDGDGRALPLVQGLVALAEETRDRPRRMVPEANDEIDLATAIETENIDAAMAATMSLIDRDASPDEVRETFIEIVSQHHLDYGHGIIYTQKIFELLDMVGWHRAGSVLPHLAAAIAFETREDLLPYMRKVMVVIEAADLDALSQAERAPTWTADEGLVDALLDSPEPPIERAIELILAGAGIDGLLDALSLASSRRLLRHRLEVEFDAGEPFGWLDITHVLTMTRAVRWASSTSPGPAAARLALFAVWLLHDSGRSERRGVVGQEVVPAAAADDMAAAIRQKDVAGTLGAVAAMSLDEAGTKLVDAALDDHSGAFIVIAHLIKLSHAAHEESITTGSPLPLLAAARYLASPRGERFVRRNVDEALAFVSTGNPPRR